LKHHQVKENQEKKKKLHQHHLHHPEQVKGNQKKQKKLHHHHPEPDLKQLQVQQKERGNQELHLQKNKNKKLEKKIELLDKLDILQQKNN
jgi:hypothetical protein